MDTRPFFVVDAPGTRVPGVSVSWPKRPIVRTRGTREARGMSEPLIEREEIVALLFNVSDITEAVTEIRGLLKGEDEDDEEAEDDES
jgi:hypothetical protein